MTRLSGAERRRRRKELDEVTERTRAAKKKSTCPHCETAIKGFRCSVHGHSTESEAQPLAAAMLRLAEKLEDENVPNERTDTVQRAEYLGRWEAARRIRETVRRFS